MTKRVLVTGAAGFVGHHLVDHLIRTTDSRLILMDRLDASGTLHRLKEVIPDTEQYRIQFVFHDLKAAINPHVASRIGFVDEVYHLAAGSHVDRSIEDPMAFVMDNVVGTCNLLNWFRTMLPEPKPSKFLYFSTDEVFGPAAPGVAFREWDRYNSGNPYAASKAGAEELCLAFANTYKLDIRIIHSMNIYGERQSPEKFIPMCISKIINDQVIQVHANSDKTKAGSRFYTYAGDVASACTFVMENGMKGEKFNVVGEREVDNEQLVLAIAEILGRHPFYELTDFHSARPGHDLRYALNGEFLLQRGWSHSATFDVHLRNVVNWTLANKRWMV